MNRLISLSLAAAAFLLALPALATVEVAGVKFEDKAKVGAAELQLNGAGLRNRAFFKVYSIGLYLPEKKGTTDAVLALKGAKRLHIATLRELTAEQFADALVGSIEKNHTEAELAPLKARIEEFKATILSLNVAPKGSVVTLDWLPESGMRLSFNGQAKGKDIAGEDFYAALLKIWLGNHPAQDNLKDALLGSKPQ